MRSRQDRGEKHHRTADDKSEDVARFEEFLQQINSPALAAREVAITKPMPPRTARRIDATAQPPQHGLPLAASTFL